MSDESMPLFPEVEYRAIAGFPGYRVGDDGSVWSCFVRAGAGRPRVQGEWWQMKPIVDAKCTKGYAMITLWAGGKQKRVSVHKLVLEAFVGKKPPGLVCRHLNGLRTKNHLDNLAWGTNKENEEDKVRHGTRAQGVRHGNAKLTEAQVLDVVASKAAGEKAPSIAARLGISISTVFLIMQGKRYSCYTKIRRSF
jgi:hypothetical protein